MYRLKVSENFLYNFETEDKMVFKNENNTFMIVLLQFNKLITQKIRYSLNNRGLRALGFDYLHIRMIFCLKVLQLSQLPKIFILKKDCL